MDKWADREWVAWVNQLGNRVAKLEYHIANRALAFACGMGRASEGWEMSDDHMRRVVTDRDNIIGRMRPVYDAAMALFDVAMTTTKDAEWLRAYEKLVCECRRAKEGK